MRAVQFTEPPRFELTSLPDPPCGPGQVIVRTAFCGLCGTDLEILRGGMPPGFVRYPIVPGHEWTGVVEEVGTQVTGWQPGDRVSVEGYLPCGECPACRIGEFNHCEKHEQIGMTHNGGFAEFVAAPASLCHRVPEHIGLDEALMVEPASTVVRGMERARIRPGLRAAIIGCGPIGQIAARVIQLHEPAAILGIDVAAVQKSIAARAGITEFTTSTDSRELRERSGGPGWDLVVNCARGLRPLNLAFDLVRPGGTVVVIGGAPDEQMFQISAHAFIVRDLHIEGILGYTPRSWVQALDLLSSGRLKLGDLITHRKPLEQFGHALELVESRSEPMGKVALAFG
ncbi:MAG: alcohol dehydrogenase catalytic domain-containing protein [Bryobacteraceae bacterium]